MAQDKTLVQRIQGYRKYDKKRWGDCSTSITYDDAIRILIEQQGKCYWTGREMTVNFKQPTDVSFDRLDCSKPHTYENTVATTRAMNLGRNDSSLRDWSLYLYSLGILADEHVKDLKELGLI